jgi:hypothetical protein
VDGITTSSFQILLSCPLAVGVALDGKGWCSFCFMATLTDFSWCHWNAESATLGAIQYYLEQYHHHWILAGGATHLTNRKQGKQDSVIDADWWDRKEKI